MDDLTAFKESLKFSFESEKPDHGAEFKLFALLPTEIRLQIWRASWIPKKIWPSGSWFIKDKDHSYLPPHTNLPITAWVNQESRQETLRMYCRFASSGFWQFDSFFNPKIDHLCLDSCHMPVCPAMQQVKETLKVERLEISTCVDLSYGSCDESCVFYKGFDTELDMEDYMGTCGFCMSYRNVLEGRKTLGNMLTLMKSQWLPSIRYLKLETHLESTYLGDIHQDVRDSVGPVFLPGTNAAEGVLIFPLLEGRDYLKGFEALFLGPHEVACMDRKLLPRAGGLVWMEYVSRVTFSALFSLDGNWKRFVQNP
ncbi:cyclin-like f-box protein [Apiospora arundinis]|uniref:Cyclin-like f-box protein n=1 Tax=Apiospora arundinis TaxID=335852 RepID=A0ABR2IAP9_9PEZI